MRNLPLTLSWEEQLLREAEKDLKAAADVKTLALSVWAVAQLAGGRLRGVSALEGFHADLLETYSTLAGHFEHNLQLAQELRTVFRFNAQVGKGASSLSALLNEPVLRELGSQLLGILRGAERPEPDVVPAMFQPARRAEPDGTAIERSN